MIEQKLKDVFNNYYIIKTRRQSQRHSTFHPLKFSSPQNAYHFMMRLRTPHGYWQRVLRTLSVAPSQTLDNPQYDGDDHAARLISAYFYRGALSIYSLPDHNSTRAAQKERHFERDNGDNYTFNDASVLLTTDKLEPVRIASKADAEALLMKIIKE